MRKLQYILNVLGYADVLNKRLDEDVYEFPGIDPFYITDEIWEEMQRDFEQKFGAETRFAGGHDEQNNTG